MGCTQQKGSKLKIYIEHSTEPNIAEAFQTASQAIFAEFKIQPSEQLNSTSKNAFQVFVINTGQSRQVVWNIQTGDEIVSSTNVSSLIAKIKATQS